MADRLLQQLRRAAAGGDPAAERRLLMERLRTGHLTEDRLELAALLGHPPALALRAPPAYGTFALALWRYGPEVVVRAGIAAARCCFAESAPPPATARALDLLQSWAATPPGPARDAARDQALALQGQGDPHLTGLLLELFAEADRGAPREVEGCFLLGPVYDLMQSAHAAVAADLERGLRERDRRRLADAVVRRAIRSDLVPWALGEDDPVTRRGVLRRDERATRG